MSALPGLRGVPLTELDDETIGEVLERIFPDAGEPDAAFQSAI